MKYMPYETEEFEYIQGAVHHIPHRKNTLCNPHFYEHGDNLKDDIVSTAKAEDHDYHFKQSVWNQKDAEERIIKGE